MFEGYKVTKIDASTLALLKARGFMWHKNGTTDRVEANLIKDIIPAASGGFTVSDASRFIGGVGKSIDPITCCNILLDLKRFIETIGGDVLIRELL
jgi:hypothetical protein